MLNNRNNKGTGFVNFKDILKANQRTGSTMGQAVGSGLETQAEAAKNRLGQEKDEFNTGFGEATQRWNSRSELARRLAEQASVGQWDNIADEGTDLTEAGKNFRNATYTGPTGFKNSQGLESQAQSASQQGNLANTSTGQQQLLRQYVGGKGYNQGMSQFDQTLMNKYGNTSLQKGKKALSGLTSNVDKAIVNAGQTAQTQQRAITAEKDKFGKDILAGGDKLLDYGKTQGADFQNSAKEFKNLMAVGGMAPGSARDKFIEENFGGALDQAKINQILGNASRFGLGSGYGMPGAEPGEDSSFGTSQVYGTDDEVSAILQSLNNSFNIGDEEATYLTDKQRGAFKNLKNFLGEEVDPAVLEQYKEPGDVTGDEAVFDKNQDVWKNTQENFKNSREGVWNDIMGTYMQDTTSPAVSRLGAITSQKEALLDSILSKGGIDEQTIANILGNSGLAAHGDYGSRAVAQQIGKYIMPKYQENEDNYYNRSARTLQDELIKRLIGNA